MQYHQLHFREIDSTNTYLKNTYKLLGNFTFVSTDYQSRGKGRNDRIWNSEPGENLMFSFLIKDENLIKQSPIISLLNAIEVAKVLETYKIKDV
ncbi:MAG: biotin--[Bacilli bacterium]|nr:biotin--[acetyl-CoA-carboxylase] ligase [Bacilli bacterium]